jgi:hypothetical protein
MFFSPLFPLIISNLWYIGATSWMHFRLRSKDKNPMGQFEVISNLNWMLSDIQKIFFARAYKMCLKAWGPF